MDLMPYVELLRRELASAAETGGDEARALAERLTAPLESAIRLTLLEALSAATAEITHDLAPGSVHLRLHGRDPDFVVTLPPADPTPEEQTTMAPPALRTDAAAAPAGDAAGHPGSTCASPKTSNSGSRRPPAGNGSRSTPGSSGQPSPHCSPVRSSAPRPAAVPDVVARAVARASPDGRADRAENITDNE